MSAPKKSLLIVKLTDHFSTESVGEIVDSLKEYADHLGFNCVVLPKGTDSEYHQPISALVDAIKQQTEAIQNLAASNMAIVDELAAANDLDGDQSDTLDKQTL